MADVVSIYRLTMDIKKPTSHIVTPVIVQYDNVRLEITVLDDGKPFDLTNVRDIRFAHKRPDGNTVVGDGELVDNKVVYNYKGNEMEVLGNVDTSFSMINGEEKVSVRKFYVVVTNDLIEDIYTPANPQFNRLQELIVEVENLSNIATESAQLANTQGDYAKAQGDYVESKRSDIEYFLNEQTNVQSQIQQVDDRLSEKIAQTPIYLDTQPGTFDNARIERAIAKLPSTGGEVLLPNGVLNINPSAAIVVDKPVKFVGQGMVSTVLKSQNRTIPMFDVRNSVRFEDIGFDFGLTDSTTPAPANETAFRLNGGLNNLNFEKCGFKNGFAGVWINPVNGLDVSAVRVSKCIMINMEFGVLVGRITTSQENRTENITDVVIENSTIMNGRSNSDGIKTSQRCSEIRIINNTIMYQQRDAIDLYTSGDNVIVSENVLAHNTLNGIDIKQDTVTYPPEIFGYNRMMDIFNNKIFYNGERGISVNQITGQMLTNYLINIANNTIYYNYKDGINVSAESVNISDNVVFLNGRQESPTSSTFAGIAVKGELGSPARNINLIGNVVMNNGNPNTLGHGIFIYGYVEETTIDNNVISNVLRIDNPNQRIGLQIQSTVTGVTVGRHNKINGHFRDVWIRNGAGVIGERITVDLGDIEGASINKYRMFEARKNTSIISMTFLNSEAIDINVADYVGLRLTKRTNNAFSPMLQYTTSASAIQPWTAVRLTAFASNPDISIDNNKVSKGDFFGAQVISSGNGRVLRNLTADINYIEY